MWRRCIIGGLIILVVCVVVAWVGVSLSIGKLVDNELRSLIQRPFTRGVVYAVFPSGVVITELNIKGLAQVHQVRVDIQPGALFHGVVKMTAMRLEDPVLWLERGEDGVPQMPVGIYSNGEKIISTASKPGLVAFKPKLPQLIVRNGIVHLREKDGREIVIEKIQADIANIPLDQRSAQTEFFATASLEKLGLPFVGHFLKVKGWLDWVEKNMEATAETVDQDGRRAVDVTLRSVKNDVEAQGTVRLSSAQAPQSAGKDSGLMEGVVLGMLGATGTDVEAKFSFRTKMDQFEISQVKITGNLATGMSSGKLPSDLLDGLKAVTDELTKEDKPAEVPAAKQ